MDTEEPCGTPASQPGVEPHGVELPVIVHSTNTSAKSNHSKTSKYSKQSNQSYHYEEVQENTIMTSGYLDSNNNTAGAEFYDERIDAKTASTRRSRPTKSRKSVDFSESSGSSKENVKFDFDSRTVFDATENLLMTRSENYDIIKPTIVYDVITRPAPDFRPQAYRPRPPKRNTVDATRPWRFTSDVDQHYAEGIKERKEKMYLPRVLGPRPDPEYQFKAGYRPLDSCDDRILQAGETGHLTRDQYIMPQPHDFRGYPPIKSLGLSEFTCSYERDPYNNKLHTRCPRTITGPPPQIVQRDIELGLFAKPLHQPPKWEVRLHHPHDKFPNRPASYTRFRRTGRDPHSAFMDRVVETIDAQWAKRRYEDSLQRHQAVKS